MSRKRGACHSKLAVMPLGMKRNGFDMAAHAALLAIERNCVKEKHLVDVYILAELCETMNQSKEEHISIHTANIKRLCDDVHGHGYDCRKLIAASMIASVSVLLPWFQRQPNKAIAETAMRKIRAVGCSA